MKLSWTKGGNGHVARPFGLEGPSYCITKGSPGPLAAFGYDEHFAVSRIERTGGKRELGGSSEFSLAAELAESDADRAAIELATSASNVTAN